MKPAGIYRFIRFPGSFCLVAICIAASAFAQDADVDAVVEEQAATSDEAQQSQELIDSLDESISDDIAATRVARQQTDRLLIYNDNLDTLIADQEREIASLEKQIAEFGDVEKNVVPFMLEMIDALARFIELDMPFSQLERGERIARLQSNMERSDLTVSEKYRQIMEAYQIEAGYGRNIEAYIGALVIDGVERRVDLLRVGRVLLAYQTLDQSGVGFWDKTSGTWTELDGSYRTEIADGLRIARKQMAPRLLELPVPAAGVLR